MKQIKICKTEETTNRSLGNLEKIGYELVDIKINENLFMIIYDVGNPKDKQQQTIQETKEYDKSFRTCEDCGKEFSTVEECSTDKQEK